MAQVTPNEVRVCSGFSEIPADHEYNDLQRAIDADPFHTDYIIRLCSDFNINPGLRIDRSKKIIIDGQGVYGIDFRPGHVIATPEVGCSLIFRNMKYLAGDAIIVRYDCEIGLYNCDNVTTSILAIDGKYSTISIKNSNVTGAPDRSALEINHDGSAVKITDSFVKGGSRCPAIYFNSDSADRVKIKNTTLLHDRVDTCAIQRDTHYDAISLLFYGCYGARTIGDVGIAIKIDDRFVNDTIDF